MNPSVVMPLLVKENVLTSEDVGQIFKQQHTRDKSMLLLSLLPTKGKDDYSYRVFFSALKNDEEHRPHQSLGADLDEIRQSKYII